MIHFAVITESIPHQVRGTTVRQPHRSLRRLAEEAHKLGMMTTLVHPADFALKSGKVTGWVGKNLGIGQENWTRTTVPIPDVVYERVSVKLAVQGIAKQVRQKCMAHGIPAFNPGLPLKDAAAQLMQRNHTINQFVPETKPAKQPDDVFEMLGRHAAVYLKPISGFGGTGVTRIRSSGDGLFLVEADRLGELPRRMSRKMTQHQLKAWIQRKIKGRHIVQQGLNLIHINGGQADFRVMLQRDESGEWQLIGITPKVAAKAGVVTNPAAGGSKRTVDWLLNIAAKQGQSVPLDKLQSAALQIASFWSTQLRTLGILGLDMGIDQHGNIWLIEANARPARSLLSNDMQNKSYRAIAGFAHHLASNPA